MCARGFPPANNDRPATLKTLVPETWRMRLADMRGRGIYAEYADRHRCIFIHIPKTAGSSVARALFGGESRHAPYSDFQRANPHKFRRYFKFAFVRHPLDRLVSSFHFLRAGGMNEIDRRWAAETLSPFADFREFVVRWIDEDTIGSFVHFRPQAAFVADERGTLQVDFVGRFENLDEDFRTVAQRLGRDITLPLYNQSGHRHYSEYYDAETTAIVRRVYVRDFRLFGYA